MLHFLAKTIKWLFAVAVPVVVSFVIYVLLHSKEYDTINEAFLWKSIPAAAEEILSHYPFVEILAKFVEKSFSLKEVSFQGIIDHTINGLLIYGMIDLGMRHYEETKSTARIETKLHRCLKLAVIYGFWVILFAYVAGLFTDYGFKWLEKTVFNQLGLKLTKLMLLVLFFAVGVARFKHFTHESFLLSVVWVFVDKICISLLNSFVLTLFALFAHRILFHENGTLFYAEHIWEAIPPFIFYILAAAGIDYLRNRARYRIIASLKHLDRPSAVH